MTIADKNQKCFVCSKTPLSKDEIGACKKILGRSIKKFFCLKCLSEELNIDEEDLKDRIEFFKNEGCTLFK